jgi:hypothetical protein
MIDMIDVLKLPSVYAAVHLAYRMAADSLLVGRRAVFPDVTVPGIRGNQAPGKSCADPDQYAIHFV